MPSPALPSEIAHALDTAASPADVLVATMHHFGCQAGTIHRLRTAGDLLELIAHAGIPPVVVQIVQTVPIGKGIAGLAAERREPVTLCNLQTDTSGQARPGAKATGMEGSIAVPMLVDGTLRGVLGIAKATAYDWTKEETELLLSIAAHLGATFSQP
jgi:L-methionine (R)-S-oxide reductase